MHHSLVTGFCFAVIGLLDALNELIWKDFFIAANQKTVGVDGVGQQLMQEARIDEVQLPANVPEVVPLEK